MKFEMPPGGQGPSDQEPAETHGRDDGSESESEGVLIRLNGKLAKWKEAYVALMGASVLSGVMKAAVQEHGDETSDTSAEVTPGSGVEEAPAVLEIDESIRKLDREASPERVRHILSTYPEGFVEGEITLISYHDEVMTMPEAYGTGGFASAQAPTFVTFDMTINGIRVLEGDTHIEFFRPSSGHRDSHELWAGTLAHEVAHGNDWETDDDMEIEDRETFREMVRERVRSEDRYRSSYVESIRNDDSEREEGFRMKEYWAEIFEAYMKGDRIPEEDRSIVEWVISKNDPDFDHRESMRERGSLIAHMEYESAVDNYGELSADGGKGLRNWVDTREEAPTEGADEWEQREGRAEVIETVAAWADTPERKSYAEALLRLMNQRDNLVTTLNGGGWGRVKGHMAEILASEHVLRERADEVGKDEAERFKAEIEELVLDRRIRIGTPIGDAGDLSGEEIRSLELNDDERLWVVMEGGWRPEVSWETYSNEEFTRWVVYEE